MTDEDLLKLKRELLRDLMKTVDERLLRFSLEAQSREMLSEIPSTSPPAAAMQSSETKPKSAWEEIEALLASASPPLQGEERAG